MQLLLALALLAPAQWAVANDADLKIRLASAPGFAAIEASAKFRNRGGVQTFEAGVNNAFGLAGMVLTVFVDGKQVGTFTVNRLGVGDLNLTTQLGQMVPQIRSGSLVQITMANGVLVASGKF